MAERLKPSVLREPVHVLATGFGTGLSPWAPGTAGSLLALLPCWLIASFDAPSKLAIAVAAFAVGVWICGASAKRLGVHDHPAIVFDEIAAMLTIMLAVPARDIVELLIAFAFFRVFDIGKPWPIRDMDHRIGGGLGIMLDDQMAALYAAVCVIVTRHVIATI
jgi:phosphatidylglycerophosphatase A